MKPTKSYQHEFSTSGKALIISVAQKARRTDRLVVVLEDESGSRLKTTISDEMFARSVYREGDEIDSAPFIEESSRVAAFDMGMATLARRSCSSTEIERSLRRRGVSADVARDTVARLTRVGLVNDVQFAEAFVRSRVASRRSSAWALRRDLARKGVSREVVDAAIADGMRESRTDELELARAAAEKKWRSLARLDAPTARRRLGAFLQRRGFTGESVRAVLREIAR
jgi:regulatory protein